MLAGGASENWPSCFFFLSGSSTTPAAATRTISFAERAPAPQPPICARTLVLGSCRGRVSTSRAATHRDAPVPSRARGAREAPQIHHVSSAHELSPQRARGDAPAASQLAGSSRHRRRPAGRRSPRHPLRRVSLLFRTRLASLPALSPRCRWTRRASSGRCAPSTFPDASAPERCSSTRTPLRPQSALPYAPSPHATSPPHAPSPPAHAPCSPAPHHPAPPAPRGRPRRAAARAPPLPAAGAPLPSPPLSRSLRDGELERAASFGGVPRATRPGEPQPIMQFNFGFAVRKPTMPSFKRRSSLGTRENRRANNAAQPLARATTMRDRKSTRLNSSHSQQSRMPSSA